ncbi:MAG: NfeD family protein [Clostridia bacterium]|nr:NfeD family protein [Clostridia bacterium]
MAQYMLAFWIVMLVAFVVIEALTAQLVTIWFAVGSVAALISEMLGAEVWLQWLIFVAVSAVVIVATRPLVKKITKQKALPTNADRCIGQTAVVTERIDNIEGKGAVKVNGIVWTARSENGETIELDQTVTVTKIDGVKLIVR